MDRKDAEGHDLEAKYDRYHEYTWTGREVVAAARVTAITLVAAPVLVVAAIVLICYLLG